MNIKLRFKNENSIIRLENNNNVKEILINEDLVHPENESIAICFADKKSSGIIELSPAEFEKIYDSVKSRIHLIKGFKRLSMGSVKL